MRNLAVIALFMASVFVSAVRAANDLSEQASRFAFYLNPEARSRAVEGMSLDEKQKLIAEMRVAAQNESSSNHMITAAMATLGDEPSLQRLVREFLEDDAQSPYLLGPMRNPRIIEMVAPEFFREEPMRMEIGDIIVVPRSYRAAELAAELLADSPAFNGEVINWGRTVRALTFTERRDLIRPWWKENENFFREKAYKAVQPGPAPPRDPFEVGDPDVPAERAPSAAAVELPVAVAAVPVPPQAKSPASSDGLLWAAAAATLALLAVRFFFWRRRA